MPTTALGVETPLDVPFNWGPVGGPGTFPGGVGTGTVAGQSYEYCVTQSLAVGQQCMVTVSSQPIDGGSGPYTTAVNVAYSDAAGPVSPNANRQIQAVPGHIMPP